MNEAGDYPCLCLCFGFSQIILICPFLLITLHFSQIGFTDDLTFMLNPPFIKDQCILYHNTKANASKTFLFFEKF